MAVIRSFVAVLVISFALSGVSAAQSITVASTTSTESSGLFELILPLFREKTGVEVRAVAVGTGQAIRIAQRGDADVLFVHDRASEEAFVADGFGVKRYDVMYNDFIVVGPREDPAGIRGLTRVSEALRRIAAEKADFTSRGDDSGTHKAELRLWVKSGIDPTPGSGKWYLETGQGQGATLNVASARGAYMIVDRGTWLAFENRGELELLVAGDPLLFNHYGLILVNPEKHPHVNARDGQRFIDWLLSSEGQAAIASLEVNGEPLFTPNAQPAPSSAVPGSAVPGSATPDR